MSDETNLLRHQDSDGSAATAVARLKVWRTPVVIQGTLSSAENTAGAGSDANTHAGGLHFS
jgi:hypothetical protein